MNDLIKRAILVVVIIVFILTLFAYFGMFTPMNKTLKKSIVNNFGQLADSKYNSLENIVNRNCEGTRSISSRTMILKKIVEYHKGEVSLQELKEFTQPKYEDGAEVLDGLLLAERLVDGETIAKYSNQDCIVFAEFSKNQSATQLELHFECCKKGIVQKIINPIYSDDKIIGYDCLAYNINESIGELNEESIGLYIALNKKIYELNNKTKLEFTEKLYEDETKIYYIEAINEDSTLVVSINKDTLFKDLDSIVTTVTIVWFVSILAVFIVLYIMFIRRIHIKLEKTKISRDEYKRQAYHDKLTNCYSRAFLDIWLDEIRDITKCYAVVMCDIDRFKTVNDDFGHIVGDEVLKAISSCLSRLLRENDYLIRYGGDEFLILLEDIDNENTEKIIERIDINTNNITGFDFKISLSHGISYICKSDNFYNKLDIADKRMYEAKNKFNQNKN